MLLTQITFNSSQFAEFELQSDLLSRETKPKNVRLGKARMINILRKEGP